MQKGGCGKSTIALSLAAPAASQDCAFPEKRAGIMTETYADPALPGRRLPQKSLDAAGIDVSASVSAWWVTFARRKTRL